MDGKAVSEVSVVIALFNDAWDEVRAAANGEPAVVRVRAEAKVVVPAWVGAVSRYAVDERGARVRDREMLKGCDKVVGERNVEDMPAHQFIWLDLETTGLDARNGLLLEFAAVLCEDSVGDDFAIVQQYTGVVHHSKEALEAVPLDHAVMKMHHDNGLWAAVRASTVKIEDVDMFLASLASGLCNGVHRSIVLAGSSVHFDLGWCRVHTPQFAQFLSHRVFDVTTLRRAVEAWSRSPTPIVWPVRNSHRALADILESINEARVARRAMGL